ncbi:thiamine pyrophosphate-binding protein [Fictibacillus sp. WQ 8-8]|uniref:thiamine pyrophosphate-binding protein n=1 Tax=Fictibacillus sp. WQ 8-8 TaxID=2938788 RepID=UPI00210B329F|nr:thiamine pyrophosphate-binding protein [Fictibacillus sp. WQ 8-8]MCQ6267603.1 thiamine pyrophosphate-binding protein [Fictibacillus sp. WQ 8-8]
MNLEGVSSLAERRPVGQYLLDCLKREGISEVFGVPGDYNFSLLDTLERDSGLSFITNRNELNAGYAADAYARINGISALITTFGVGEMSATNAIAGAFSEAFGACMAAKDRRVLLFTGDGSLQLTVQEISSMLENGCKPIIFILNNNGYTIEKYLNVKVEIEKQKYNEIPSWNYTKLAEAFGREAFTKQVRTNQELDDAITEAERLQGEKLCMIELVVEDPMDAPEYLQKMRAFLEKQEKKK